MAIDITHYQYEPNLTMIDYRPERVVIWKKNRVVTAKEATKVHEKGFSERSIGGYGMSFCSEAFRELCKKWDIRQYLKFAHRPSGNGIIERQH